MFVRRGAHRTPFQRPDHTVAHSRSLSHAKRTSRLMLEGKLIVLVDRLKPAHIDPDLPAPVAWPRPRECLRNTAQLAPHRASDSMRTCSERKVLAPQHYISVLGGSGGAER